MTSHWRQFIARTVSWHLGWSSHTYYAKRSKTKSQEGPELGISEKKSRAYKPKIKILFSSLKWNTLCTDRVEKFTNIVTRGIVTRVIVTRGIVTRVIVTRVINYNTMAIAIQNIVKLDSTRAAGGYHSPTQSVSSTASKHCSCPSHWYLTGWQKPSHLNWLLRHSEERFRTAQ